MGNELLTYKIEAGQLFKFCKVLFSFNKKDSKIKFVFQGSRLILYSNYVIAEFPNSLDSPIEEQLGDYSFYGYTNLQFLEAVNKLKKKQQEGNVFIKFDYEAKTGSLAVESLGLIIPFSFESAEDFETFEDLNYGDLYEPTYYSLISRVASKQKDLNYFCFQEECALAVGDQQFSLLYDGGELKKVKDNKKYTVNSTALNNLIKASSSGRFVDYDDSLGLHFYAKEGQFLTNNLTVQLPEVKVKKGLDFVNWVELDNNFKYQHEFKLTNTKQLDSLISTSKRVDKLDLCKLELLKDKIAISFFLNKEEVGRFEFQDLLMELPDVELELVLQVKHLQSLLQLSNNEIKFGYMHNQMPLYSETDMGVCSYTMLSLVK